VESIMNFDVLATDYDGTIAHDGRVDDETVAALRRARDAGLKLLLVTGRELTDLSNTFQHTGLFDLVVAENGAVLFDPRTASVRLLAPAPPAAFVEWLTARNVPLSVGHSIVATVEPHEHEVLEAIHVLGLEWHIIFNKEWVMALPSGVTKATGLAPALEELGVSPERTVGIGDAENDQAFLAACGLAVAVSNALDSVKQSVDLVTSGARGAGVAECIDRLRRGELDNLPRRRHRAS
jgi:hydroxymethylpyrimidine pyrophosphatase-like HAD family hydrolase